MFKSQFLCDVKTYPDLLNICLFYCFIFLYFLLCPLNIFFNKALGVSIKTGFQAINNKQTQAKKEKINM